MQMAFLILSCHLTNKKASTYVYCNMFKKSIILSFGIFLLLFSCSLLFHSCKCEKKVCNFTFKVITSSEADSLNLNNDDGIDTSLNGIHFSYTAFYEAENPACAWRSVGFNSAYAFTQYCTVLNPIIAESYIIKLDKDILFNTDTITAGTNLIKHPALKAHWNTDNIEDGFRGSAQIYGTIHLDSTISNQIVFDTGMYDVEFGFATEDGQNLSKKLKVVYKL